MCPSFLLALHHASQHPTMSHILIFSVLGLYVVIFLISIKPSLSRRLRTLKVIWRSYLLVINQGLLLCFALLFTLIEVKDMASAKYLVTLFNSAYSYIFISVLTLMLVFMELFTVPQRGTEVYKLILLFVSSIVLLYVYGVTFHGYLTARVELEALPLLENATDVGKIKTGVELAKRYYQIFVDSMNVIGIMLTLAAAFIGYVVGRAESGEERPS